MKWDGNNEINYSKFKRSGRIIVGSADDNTPGGKINNPQQIISCVHSIATDTTDKLYWDRSTLSFNLAASRLGQILSKKQLWVSNPVPVLSAMVCGYLCTSLQAVLCTYRHGVSLQSSLLSFCLLRSDHMKLWPWQHIALQYGVKVFVIIATVDALSPNRPRDIDCRNTDRPTVWKTNH